MTTVVELEVPGRMDVIDDLEDSVVRLGQTNGLDPDASYFLGVALREALLNAILHGRALDHGRPVQVPVQIGASDGQHTQILGGELREGDQVITGGGPRPDPADRERAQSGGGARVRL